MSDDSRNFASAMYSVTAVVLSLLLPAQVVVAQTEAGTTPAKSVVLKLDVKRTDTDPRILHMLSRFTFGPTTEEIAAVRALGKNGIDRWFDEQLDPDRSPVSAGDQFLATRLADFPALQLPADELLQRFPSGAIVRQTANGKLPIPDDPYLYAIYRRHIKMYKDKEAKKEQASNKTGQNQPDLSKPDIPTQQMAAMPGKTEMPVAGSGEAATAAANSGPVNSSPVNSSPVRSDPAKLTPSEANRPAYADLLVQGVMALPANQRLHRLLFMQPSEFEQLQSSLKGPQRARLAQDMTPEERELFSDYENPTRAVVEELQAERLLRDIYSSRQLQEVMTTFWLNHFNVYLHKNEEAPYYLVSYERDVIAPRALGNFEDLLIATAQSPAMLQYLDNSSSTGPDSPAAEKQKERAALGKAGKTTPPGLNENYARELMELHTLGVNGGYTQQDVTEVAKVFTGWTVDRPQLGGGFKFDETRHEPGKKLVLGHKIKENGYKEGLQLLHLLATSPATAHFISQELAIAFVSDNPPAALVNRMAHTFQSSGEEIAAVLRTMLHSPEFWAAGAYQAKVKTPLEYVVSAARASGAEILNTQPLVNALNQMGMPLYGCVPPTGYSDKADAWVSTGELVTRMNFALSLATNHFGGIKSQWTPAAPRVTTPTEVEQALETRLIPAGVSEKTRAAVLDQAQSQNPPPPPSQPQTVSPSADTQPVKAKPQNPNVQERQNAQIAALLLGSPEFQRR
jgi:uncharacterized protein (DUF1800 family)